MRRRLVPATTLALLIITSGCAGLSSFGDSKPPQTTPGDCSEQAVVYNVSVPEKPSQSNESKARALAKSFEKRYKVARIRTEHENVTMDSTRFREVASKRIDSGFEVTVELYLHYSTERLTAQEAYPTTYRITDKTFERGGRPLACW